MKTKDKFGGQHRGFRAVPLNVKGMGNTPVVSLELVDQHEGSDRKDVAAQREQLETAVQDLMEQVKAHGEQVVVVDVNTPAVDPNKELNADQLNFIKNDIMSSIKSQLGCQFEQEVEDKWSTAFTAMMEIVKKHKDNK